jgi:PAS domain S-box-containing protein
MHPLAPYLAIPLLIGAVITLSLTIYAWGRRGDPGVPAFLLTALGLGTWSIFYSLEIMSAEFETKLFWHKMVYSVIVLVPGPWALFLYQYDTRIKRPPRWLPWSLVIQPLLFVLLTWTNDWHQLIWRSVEFSSAFPDLEFTRGPFFWFHTIYSYLLILIATFFFYRMLWREPSLPRWQLAALGLAAIAPLLVNIIHVVKLNPFYPLDLTPFALATTGAASAWYAFRFEIWDFLPAARNAIIESMNDGVLVLDVDHRVLDINPTALNMLGLQRADALDRHIGEVLPHWQGAQVRTDAGVPTGELRLSDNRFVDLVAANLYDRGNRVTGMLVTLRNITRHKRAEQALAEERTLLTQRVQEQTADLRKANAELARVAKMKDEFLANMSHELRTPLNTVLGLSEALQEQIYGTMSERQIQALRNIEESGRHLLTLINDILDVSKIEAGKLTLELQPANVDGVCQASLGLVRQMAHKKRIEVTYTPDPGVNIILADERRLKQILVNLLSNAVKFTPEGGKIGLEVKGDLPQEAVQFTVWDAGIGIAEEDLSRLFEPFVQLDSRLARYHEGSGLGLALVYRMTELHGGSVRASSTVGVGSRFTVALPWQEPTMQAFVHSAGEAEGALARLRRVLLLDNSPTTVEQVRRYLLELGAETVVLPEPSQLLTVVRRERPDLIILDAHGTGQPASELLALLRQDRDTGEIPVLILSVSADALPLTTTPDGAGQRVLPLLKPLSRQQLSQALLKIFQPPVALSEHRRDQPPSATDSASACHPLLLLVEDNETNIRTLVDYLQARQYRVEVARSGVEAMALVRQQRPHLVLMDIQMPNMDGIEVIRQIRLDSALAALPIIALTALAMPGDRDRTLAAGANDYLSKPVSLKRLSETIKSRLEQA